MASGCGTFELVVDQRGTVVSAGSAIAQLCGWTPDELVGRPITRVLRGPAMTAPSGTCARVSIKTRSDARHEGTAVRMPTSGGMRFTVLPAAKGEPAGNRMPTPQTPQRDVQRLVDQIVQDCQNPLTGIIGFAALSNLAPTPHRRRYYLDQVTTQAQRCRRLVQSLGALMQRPIPHPACIDMAQETAYAVSGLRSQLEGHGISLEIAESTEPLWVTLDGKLLGDAVCAIVFRGTLGMRPSHQAREVRVSYGTEGDTAWTTVCFDTVNSSNRALRGRFEASAAKGGRGLNLSDLEIGYARDLMAVQGGSIAVDLDPEFGDVEVRLSAPRAAAPRHQNDETRTPIPLNLLAIDNDAMLGELYIELLGVSGHTVTACRSLRAARAAMQNERFDAVISDFFLQDGTLPELWAEAAERHHALRDRLLIVTGKRSDPIVREWLDTGGTPILHKPFTAQSLLNELTALTA